MTGSLERGRAVTAFVGPVTGAPMRTMSPAGRRFLASFEGYVLTPYNDKANNAHIGIGHLIHFGPVTSDDIEHYENYRGLTGRRRAHRFDRADAYDHLEHDLRICERDLATHIHVDLTQNQVDATLDLVFNCGPTPLTGTFGGLLNERDWIAAADAMLAWRHAGGAVSPGLTRRREADRRLFLTP